MSSEHLSPQSRQRFAWSPELDSANYVFAKYRIETKFGSIRSAYSMAQEQSVSAFGLDVLKRDVDLSNACARVVDVVTLERIEHSCLPTYLLGEDVQADPLGFQVAEVVIAYPVDSLFGSLQFLWNVVMGELPRHGILGAVRLIGLELPNSFTDRFDGPKYGVSGIRKKLGVRDRPVLCRSTQPPVGLTVAEMTEVNQAVLEGGFDLTKDDELTGAFTLAEYSRRTRTLVAAADAAGRTAGEQKSHFANTLGLPLEEAIRCADRDAAAGVLVANGIQGVDAVARARSVNSDCMILSHNAGSDLWARHERLGVAPWVTAHLERLAGADFVMLPGPAASRWQNDDEIRRCVDACLQPIGGLRPAMPILCGAKRSEHAARYRNLIGSDDYMLIVATALNEHPGGLAAGARLFRAEWH